ncbi:MAG: hypothetical protein Q9171_002896 [Xanthocarpia ochracea]
MPLQLQRVTSDAEFNDLVQCVCESYATPVNRLWRLFRHDPSPAGFIELRDRLIREFRADPAACWLKIVDTDIGDKVVGAALWNTYTENPYPVYKDHPMEAEWWPEGVKEADRLNLESFIEATDLGKLTYEACGFVYAGTNYLESAKRKASPEWRVLERDMQTPIHMYRMWRPAGGKWVEGETQLPWEED